VTKRKRNHDTEDSIQEEEEKGEEITTKQTKKGPVRDKKDPIQRLSSLERLFHRFKSNYEKEMESLKSQLFHYQNVIHSLQTKSEVGADALVPVPVRRATVASAQGAVINLDDDDNKPEEIVIPSAS
jgi:hypothetical protein